MSRHTYDMGLVGNCAYLAYVDRAADVVWLCWPRFDSSFVFGSLLDRKRGGEFSVRPNGEFRSTQAYVENTNVLRTEIESDGGRYSVTDFAPRFSRYDRNFRPLMLVRKVEPLAGSPRIRVVCRPVGEYGAVAATRHRASNHVEFHGLPEQMRLTSNVPIEYLLEERDFVLTETKYLVLTWGAPLEAPLAATADEFLDRTIAYWRRWVKSTTIADLWQKEVIRSALALKIHQYEDTGAIIASGTTSLPEFPGSGRNWDYRYCWLRDAYYILNAFNNVGHFEELERYFHFIANITDRPGERYQPLYSISGGRRLVESTLPLAGYLGEGPVRVGNDAYTHVQNDVYGQVVLALLVLWVDRRFALAERRDTHALLSQVLGKLEETVEEPDAGLWEFRTLAQQHCYTALFHWAGASAVVRVASLIGDLQLAERATEVRERAARLVEACWDPERGVYTGAVGSPHLDASTLQLVMMGYLDPSGERAKSHVDTVVRELGAGSSLMYRYRHVDDFGAPETTFLICAFWAVEALACVGRVDEAAARFRELTGFANDLGLLSEDVDPKDGSQWGNFPQAYSHVGLLNAAFRIAKKLDRPNYL